MPKQFVFCTTTLWLKRVVTPMKQGITAQLGLLTQRIGICNTFIFSRNVNYGIAVCCYAKIVEIGNVKSVHACMLCCDDIYWILLAIKLKKLLSLHRALHNFTNLHYIYKKMSEKDNHPCIPHSELQIALISFSCWKPLSCKSPLLPLITSQFGN